MQGSADTLFIYTFFSGLPPEGLRSMPKITIDSKNRAVFLYFVPENLLFRHLEKKQFP